MGTQASPKQYQINLHNVTASLFDIYYEYKIPLTMNGIFNYLVNRAHCG
jgi:hypothetical protein